MKKAHQFTLFLTTQPPIFSFCYLIIERIRSNFRIRQGLSRYGRVKRIHGINI